MSILKSIFCVLVFGLLSVVFLAKPDLTFASGGAYVVDDAVIVEKGQVQIETWYRTGRSGRREFTVAPAFQILESLEMTFQGTRWRENNDYNTAITLEGKYVPLELSDIPSAALGLAAGSTYLTDDDRLAEVYAYLPLTYLFNSRTLLHANLGWEYSRPERENSLIWGVALNRVLVDQLEYIGEVFGEESGAPGFQTGLRLSLFKALFELDLIYSRNLQGEKANWFTTGATLRF